MKLIERYLFRQLLRPFVLAVAAFSVMAVVSQALSSFQFVDARPETMLILLKVTALAYPQLLSLILPVALFVSTSLAMKRLHDDREIVICYSSGLARWGVIAPGLLLGAAAMGLALVLNLWVSPPAARAMRFVIRDARSDIVGSLLRPGEFVQPAGGLTFFAERSDVNGRMKNVFLHQDGVGGGSTYLAREARLVVVGGRPTLIMQRGSNQSFSRAGVLNFISFDQWSFDLSAYLAKPAAHLELSDYDLAQLLRPDPGDAWASSHHLAMLAEANARLAGALYNPAFVLMALAGVLAAPFDRRGLSWPIAVAAMAAGAARLTGFGAEAFSAHSEVAIGVQYLVPLVAGGASLAVLCGFGPVRSATRRRAYAPMLMARVGAQS